jgi:hypothetical protein
LRSRNSSERTKDRGEGKRRDVASAVPIPLLNIRQFAAFLEAEEELGALERAFRRERDTRKASKIAAVRAVIARALRAETELLAGNLKRL